MVIGYFRLPKALFCCRMQLRHKPVNSLTHAPAIPGLIQAPRWPVTLPLLFLTASCPTSVISQWTAATVASSNDRDCCEMSTFRQHVSFRLAPSIFSRYTPHTSWHNRRTIHVQWGDLDPFFEFCHLKLAKLGAVLRIRSDWSGSQTSRRLPKFGNETHYRRASKCN